MSSRSEPRDPPRRQSHKDYSRESSSPHRPKSPPQRERDLKRSSRTGYLSDHDSLKEPRREHSRDRRRGGHRDDEDHKLDRGKRAQKDRERHGEHEHRQRRHRNSDNEEPKERDRDDGRDKLEKENGSSSKRRRYDNEDNDGGSSDHNRHDRHKHRGSDRERGSSHSHRTEHRWRRHDDSGTRPGRDQNYDSTERKPRNYQDHDRSRYRRIDSPPCSPDRRAVKRRRSPSPPPPASPGPYQRSRGPLPSQQDAFGRSGTGPPGALDKPAGEKQQPNFSRSGKLAAETNTVAGTGVVLKYHEPAEARVPPASADWRLFEFKDSETLSTTVLSERSCWLIGREQAVADFPVLHPSCSAQHAVLQFRYVEKKNEFGDKMGKVRLYLLDLDSANGTFLNGERIGERRFVEVRGGDVIKFGESTREYVVMLA